MTDFLNELTQIIKKRKQEPEENSYTSSLFQKGKDRILKKIGEEAGEVIIASKNNDKVELKNEAADLLFHLMIALQELDLNLEDVVEVLKERHNK
jgi:phosphoribosyl-ATP pyrophosphohydrolase